MILEDFICSPMISETRKKFVITGLPGSSMIINEPQNITCHPSPKRKAVGSNPARNAFLGQIPEKSVSAFLILGGISK